jgi:D-alanyl-D-alanine-carboxypeptidase/D-alanyl-D-alanine-endopeptidase
MRPILPALALVAAASALPAQAPAPFPADSAVRAILQQRVDSGRAVGLVVGLLENGKRRVIVAGASGTARALDGRTLFEIGSITKTFTATLLADMAQRGVVRLDQPVAELLPAGTAVPTRNGRAITLEDLSAQRSGLPRMPGNFAPKNPDDPYADYDAARMYAFLASYALPRDPGATFEYSNLGVGLLGHALARRSGGTYETLARERILDPLGMRDTRVTPDGAQAARVAQGHGETMLPVGPWHLDALAGAGALRSTADDMLTYLAAELGDGPPPLVKAMRETQRARGPAGPLGQIGLGWIIARTSGGRAVHWHNGGTGGFRTFAAFDTAARRAVVVLANSGVAPDDIGMHLAGVAPLRVLPAVRRRVAIAVDSAALEQLVGDYPLAPTFVLGVRRRGDALWAEATGQQPFRLWAESPTAFFLKEIDAQVTFELDPATGRARALVLHQNNADQRAERRP